MGQTRIEPIEGRYGTTWWMGAVAPGGGAAMTAAELARCVTSDDTWFTTNGVFNAIPPSAYPFHLFRFDLSDFAIDDILTVLYSHEGHTRILTGPGGPRTDAWSWSVSTSVWWAGTFHTNAFDTVIGGSCGALPVQYIDGADDLWIGIRGTPAIGGGTGTLRLYTDCVYVDVYHRTRGIAMPRTNPAQVLSVASTAGVHLDVTDWMADGASTTWLAYVAKLLDDQILADVSVTSWGSDVLAAVLPVTQGELWGTPHVGVLRFNEFMPKGAIPVIGSGFEYVEIEVMPSGSMVVALLLYYDAGTYRWYQTCGLWDHVAGEFDWTAPPVECETGAVDFPDAQSAKGSLRHTADGGLLFAFMDSAGDTRLYRCASMPSDATGTWEEV